PPGRWNPRSPSIAPWKALPHRLPPHLRPGTAMQNPQLPPNPSAGAPDRYERGPEKPREIDGAAGQAVDDSLADIAPDFARYLIEFPFGDIYARPGLSTRDREIAVVAALAALGHAQPQLGVHVQAALNVGVTREEIIEILMMMSVYAGFPAALNALSTARIAFRAHAGEAHRAAPVSDTSGQATGLPAHPAGQVSNSHGVPCPCRRGSSGGTGVRCQTPTGKLLDFPRTRQARCRTSMAFQAQCRRGSSGGTGVRHLRRR